MHTPSLCVPLRLACAPAQPGGTAARSVAGGVRARGAVLRRHVPHPTEMADPGTASGAGAAAPPELVAVLARADALCNQRRFESAVAKSLEAVALARAAAAPHSLLRAYALLQYAESLVAQQGQLYDNSAKDTRGRSTFAQEEALCKLAYEALTEALPILFARGHANSLLPGFVPADEEAAHERLIVRGENGAESAADLADARHRRRGPRLGFQLFLQGASISLLALYPAVFNAPFPSLNTDGVNEGREDIKLLMDCVVNATTWLANSVNPPAAGSPQWLIGGGYSSVLEESKLCHMLTQLVDPTAQQPPVDRYMTPQQLAQLDSPFYRMLHGLWHHPRMAARRRIYTFTAPHFSRVVDEAIERGEALVQRHGLAACGNAGCGRVESCPKAFKVCARCRSAAYCSQECATAAWRTHRADCKRIAEEREERGGAGASKPT